MTTTEAATVHCKFGCGYEAGSARPEVVIATHHRSCKLNPDRELTQDELEAQWPARIAETGQPIPLEDLSSFAKTRTALECVLQTLVEAGGSFTDDSGLATGKLLDKLPFDASKSINPYLERLVRGGWITRDKKSPTAKRTFRIALCPDVTVPEPTADAAPKARTPISEMRFDPGPDEPLIITRREDLHNDPEAIVPLTDEGVPEGYVPADGRSVERDDEADELGMRPGRLAARIEKNLPGLVKTAVHDELASTVGTMLNALGFYQGVSPEAHDQLEAEHATILAENARLRSTVESVNEDRIRQQSLIDYLTDQEDERLRRSNEGQVASKHGLTVKQLPDVLQRTGEHAMSYGWSIHRTRGSTHLAWRSPDGRMCLSASTPGDRKVDQILWRKLRRMGLEDFRGVTRDRADEGQHMNGAHGGSPPSASNGA